jgi:glutamyl-tRNA synthetase/nondiscriminating glutamyl-tRNA synthetase
MQPPMYVGRCRNMSRDEAHRRIEDVGKSAGVFDPEKLAWVNRHYLKLAPPERLADLTTPFLAHEGWIDGGNTESGIQDPQVKAFVARAASIAAASVDRLDQIPARLRFLFDFAAERSLDNAAIRAEAAAARAVIAALADELARSAPLRDKETFRSLAARVRDRTGAKGRALFHPIRLALTGEQEGLELDLAVPLIELGAGTRAVGMRQIVSASERASAFLLELEKPDARA